MYRKILLCYDGTAEGRKALREGAELAISMRADTHLLAICRSMLSTAIPEGVTPALVACEEDTARALLEEGVAWLSARGVRAEGELAIGDPLRRIPEAAARVGADLVVVGHHRRGRLARWWSDSP
ncbi:MAG TPA: universal stress protein, partial [Gammaproteobacteria bacterium]|nr:universal stress protein [Gammaproteobacteria bacterium]